MKEPQVQKCKCGNALNERAIFFGNGTCYACYILKEIEDEDEAETTDPNDLTDW